jgi:5-methylcytosine-specific restriction endonuclease McrA
MPEIATELAAAVQLQPALRPRRILNPQRRRRYSAAVRRAVYLRDGKRCTYVSPDGRRCNARHCLELDHIEPVAAGGEDTIANLRLRCRAHNQRYARVYFGSSRITAAIRDTRTRLATLRE